MTSRDCHACDGTGQVPDCPRPGDAAHTRASVRACGDGSHDRHAECEACGGTGAADGALDEAAP